MRFRGVQESGVLLSAAMLFSACTYSQINPEAARAETLADTTGAPEAPTPVEFKRVDGCAPPAR